MRAKVAVATVQGKAYYLIVNELKRRSIPFISIFPGDPLGVEVKAVITTKQEAPLISHGKVVVFDLETDPYILGTEIVKILRGKETYSRIVVGVDPGMVFGLAVIADEAVIDTENCLSIEETLNKIKSILKTINFSRSAIIVKIGSGVPVHRELLETLDAALPLQVKLEIVGEAGTNRYTREVKNRRGLRHMVSATRIARRSGYIYPRRRENSEPHS